MIQSKTEFNVAHLQKTDSIFTGLSDEVVRESEIVIARQSIVDELFLNLINQLQSLQVKKRELDNLWQNETSLFEMTPTDVQNSYAALATQMDLTVSDTRLGIEKLSSELKHLESQLQDLHWDLDAATAAQADQ